MHESVLVHNLLNKSFNPIFVLDLNSNVIFWNSSCESFFKYDKNEVLGKKLPFITPTSEYEFDFVIAKCKNKECFNFKSQKRNKDNDVLDMILFSSPLIIDDVVVGISFIVHEASLLKNLTYIPLDSENILRDQKRTFDEIRKIILSTLFDSKKTINQLSIDSGVNWRTVEKHLTFLIGKKYVNEIFSSEYVRIFELTSLGKELVESFHKENLTLFVKK